MNKKQILMDKNNTQYANNMDLPFTAINSFNIVGKKIYKRPFIFNDKKVMNIKEKKIYLNEPFIFKKKESPVKTLRYINNDTGKMRHFTPGAQE
jgi:hypothetical protein